MRSDRLPGGQTQQPEGPAREGRAGCAPGMAASDAVEKSLLERCQSGRMGRTRNALTPCGVRGFDQARSAAGRWSVATTPRRGEGKARINPDRGHKFGSQLVRQFIGEVPEWPNGTHSKCVDPLRGPRVRIPPSPPNRKKPPAGRLFYLWTMERTRTQAQGATRQHSPPSSNG